MTRPALAVVGGSTSRGAPIELRDDDRFQSFATPIRTLSWAMVVVAIGSLAVHVVLMALAVIVARAPMESSPQHEIAIEVIRQVPPPPAAKVPETKPPAPLKVPEPAKAELAKSEPTKTQPIKTEQAKTEQAKPEPAPARPEANEISSLRNELSRLRAEQEALKAEQAQEASGKALALPSIGVGDGDAVGYQQLVFSQLAKAKGEADYNGQAGTTGVKFEMDESGKLVRVEIVRSSGSATLDGRALDIIHRAAPFPPPPTAADRVVFANVNFVPPKTPAHRP